MEWGDGPDAISAATDELDQSGERLGGGARPAPQPPPTSPTSTGRRRVRGRSTPGSTRWSPPATTSPRARSTMLRGAPSRGVPLASRHSAACAAITSSSSCCRSGSERRMFHLSMKMAAPGDEQASTATAAAVVVGEGRQRVRAIERGRRGARNRGRWERGSGTKPRELDSSTITVSSTLEESAYPARTRHLVSGGYYSAEDNLLTLLLLEEVRKYLSVDNGQAQKENTSSHTEVTLYLDGTEHEFVENFIHCQGHYRFWLLWNSAFRILAVMGRRIFHCLESHSPRHAVQCTGEDQEKYYDELVSYLEEELGLKMHKARRFDLDCTNHLVKHHPMLPDRNLSAQAQIDSDTINEAPQALPTNISSQIVSCSVDEAPQALPTSSSPISNNTEGLSLQALPTSSESAAGVTIDDLHSFCSQEFITDPVNSQDPHLLGEGTHWSLLVFDRNLGGRPCLAHHDSSPGDANLRAARRLAASLLPYLPPETKCTKAPTPKQNNGTECALYMIKCAEVICGWWRNHAAGGSESHWLGVVARGVTMDSVDDLRAQLIHDIGQLLNGSSSS
uniref:Ubiquitin-like protease family profile domain-containing protein n=1 Tax=Oryza rufipogon TaxID=4529 RepID=A0A0E0QKR7_ORYRU